ncbi:PilZ domain-containing protein [Polynucleobacter sp. JS-Safj-400b-B2]|uniref:PilZ domain-containing protein n=1 Tax=Polynucleobacter sp. JS-Safj-400b-B2 TaxID=2576921 RepID=UPI001C0B1E09|nr:PilZ domain-containing protein [Polynucleobacter sp. JS-Safj-400b-B2]
MKKPSLVRDRAPRIQTSLPVLLDGKVGVTKHISSTGILFEFDDEYVTGSQIRFELEMNTPGGPLKVMCSAEVVRVTKESGRSSIAAKITRQTLLVNEH